MAHTNFGAGSPGLIPFGSFKPLRRVLPQGRENGLNALAASLKWLALQRLTFIV